MGEPSGDSAIRFGLFEVDLRSGELRKAGIRIKLQDQPFKVLAVLLERPGGVITREELKQRIWPEESFGDFDHAVNVAVAKLRAALGDSPETPRFVETLHRRGYRFLAPVSGLEGDVAAITGPDASGSKKRAYVVAALAFTGILAIVASVIASYRISRSAKPNLQSMQFTKLTDNGGAVLAAISPDGKYVVYERAEGDKLELWLRQVGTHTELQIPGAEGLFITGLAFSTDGNYLYLVRNDKDDSFLHHLYRMPVLGGPAQHLLTDVDVPVSFSPSGREFVFTRADPTRSVVEVRVANADGLNEHLLATMQKSSADSRAAAGASWSPDGKTICVPLEHLGQEKRWVLQAISVADGTSRELYSSSWGVGRALWQPDGKSLVVELEDRAGRGQLWIMSYPDGKLQRLTNDISDYSSKSDITRDGKTIVSVAHSQISNIWTVPSSDPKKSKQVTRGNLPMIEAAETADGRILSIGVDGDIWSMKDDGNERSVIPTIHNARGIAACGRYILVVSTEGSADQLMRIESDGSRPTELVSGALSAPACSADKQSVFYLDLRQPRKIRRIPVEGGPSVEVAKSLGEGNSGVVSASPDGRFLAYPYDQSTTNPEVDLAVIPAAGGPPIRTIKGLAGLVRWSPDSRGLDYIKSANGVGNIWEQRLMDGPPRQLTHFASERIFNFNWSADGQHLLLLRGDFNNDVVLITNFR